MRSEENPEELWPISKPDNPACFLADQNGSVSHRPRYEDELLIQGRFLRAIRNRVFNAGG